MVDVFPCNSRQHEKDFYDGKDFCSRCGQPFVMITTEGQTVVKWDKKKKKIIYPFRDKEDL